MNSPVRLLSRHDHRKVSRVRVMIVDDSLTVRTIFKRMIDGSPHLSVASTASSAEQALHQLRNSEEIGRIDVILLDLEMPGMGGLQALPAILETAQAAQVLVVSSLTQDGAQATLQALSIGAADTLLKPRPGGFDDDYRDLLLEKIQALGGVRSDSKPVADPINDSQASKCEYANLGSFRPEVVAIGASTGGIHALNVMMRSITPDFDLPVLITQHLPSSFISVFARQIEGACGRRTVIAENGTPIQRGEIAIATSHGHMAVRRQHGQLICGLSTEPARSGCLPSVDPMLSSIADACDGKALAIILSGMGRDGSEGAHKLVEKGGIVFAQDAATSAVWGMPGAVAKAGLASLVAPPEKLAEAILALSNAETVN